MLKKNKVIYSSGLNALELGDKVYEHIIKPGFKYIYELDFTSFDSSQGKEHFDAENMIYN